ncbi:hypothetical protein P691DRAFT_757393 [Macrolepiota fuliginosa MF-IS2]|uniref:BAG domain-containing protein n=1 Tax=Macrolepiota fuliginosa MF-IS2 TaxID=1400762 RepID=A0A9P6C6Y8_9AGAR|nr:hypothetical protein P691DRAFT_757393 [Macrolepiota fuliginosa MF-IS2]
MTSYYRGSHPYPNSPYLHSKDRQPPQSSSYQYSAGELGEQEWQQLWHTRVTEEQKRRAEYQEMQGQDQAGEERDRWRQPQAQPGTYEHARSRARSHSRGPSRDRLSRPSLAPNKARSENDLRIQQSLHAIEDISSQFNDFQRGFVLPSTISFQISSPPAGIVTISTISPYDRKYADSDSNVPKLAYDSTNRNLHAYLESLEGFISKLDDVKSWDVEDVRGRRKAGIKKIQEERDRVEGIWKASWLKHVEEQGASSNNRKGFWN